MKPTTNAPQAFVQLSDTESLKPKKFRDRTTHEKRTKLKLKDEEKEHPRHEPYVRKPIDWKNNYLLEEEEDDMEELELDYEDDAAEEVKPKQRRARVSAKDSFSKDKWDKFKTRLSFNPNGWRGLTERASKYFGFRWEYDQESGELVAMHTPTTKKYEMSGLKTRFMPKDFKSSGVTGWECEMHGQARFRDATGKYVVIVAGEVDLLSAYEILETDRLSKGGKFPIIPVVSPTIGESGTFKQIQSQYEWLDRFERIVLCFDNDKAGERAVDKIVEKCASILPKNKLYVMRLSRKDTNEYVWDAKNGCPVNHHKEWLDAFWKQEKYIPSGIVGSGHLLNMVAKSFRNEYITLPPFMSELQDAMAGGIELGTIVNIGSASGTGKSTIIDEMIYHWVMKSVYKVGIVTLEADCARYGKNLLSRHVGRKISTIPSRAEQEKFFLSQQVQDAAMKLFYTDDGDHRFHLIDNRDAGLDDLIKLISHLIIACGCAIIVLDPLQDILDGLPNEEQAKFMKWQKGMVKSHPVTFININHVRKSSQGQKANSVGAELHEEDFHGASNIFKSGACNLLFMRDKEAEDDIERNTTYIKATKVRWTGFSGKCGIYYYDNKTHTMHDREKMPGMPKGDTRKANSKKGGDGGGSKGNFGTPVNRPSKFTPSMSASDLPPVGPTIDDYDEDEVNRFSAGFNDGDDFAEPNMIQFDPERLKHLDPHDIEDDFDDIDF